MTVFVDTNVLLRFLVDDDKAQADQAEALITAARAGKLDLICGPPVLFELAWTLRGSYGYSRGQVLETLESLRALAGLKLLDAPLLQSALSLAKAHGMEFADAYIAAGAIQQKAELATFNTRDFKKSPVELRPWKRAE